MIALPPLLADGVNEMSTFELSGVADTPVGTSGTVRGVTPTLPEAPLEPATFLAVTLQLYRTPLTIEATINGDAAPVAVRVV